MLFADIPKSILQHFFSISNSYIDKKITLFSYAPGKIELSSIDGKSDKAYNGT